MYISEIHLINYKNYSDTIVSLSEGLNIIVGANNTGKTNLMSALNFISNKPLNDINNFNKYDLTKNMENYKKTAPIICIEYTIEHDFTYDVEDSALFKLKSIIIYDKNENLQEDNNGKVHIGAKLSLKYELNKTYENEYKRECLNVNSLEELINILDQFKQYYSWTYYNTNTGDQLTEKEINEIFEIDFIEANRSIGGLTDKSKAYVDSKIKEDSVNEKAIQQDITQTLRDRLSGVVNNINKDIKEDQEEIGIIDGRNEFISDFIFDSELSKFFTYSLKDEKVGFDLPLDNNGLGYNNLIYIRNLIKQKKDNDYNILMIEEPEAHLHPNMQYKLLKYLNSLETQTSSNRDSVIKNQIIISTHSPNISASVDLDNIISLYFDKQLPIPNIQAVRLSDCFNIEKVKQIIDVKNFAQIHKISIKKEIKNLESQLKNSKKHLQKFLDVTRSDILYSDKIILVEGLAEKIIVPAIYPELIKKHTCIIDVSGINFNHFIPLTFFTNKKILCITDKDYHLYDEDQKKLNSIKEYQKETNHISEYFKNSLPNIKIVEQENFGATLEQEIFISNFKNNFKYLIEKYLPKAYKELASHKTIKYWYNNKHKISHTSVLNTFNSKIDKYWNTYCASKNKDKKLIELMFFTNLFYYYVENKKGDFALEIIDDFTEHLLIVPNYLVKELQWINE